MLEFVVRSMIIGGIATIVLDLWNILLHKLFQVPLPNWAMVGRWVAHIPKGTFIHDSIGKASAVKNELAIGWIFHYLVGMSFAAAIMVIWTMGWAHSPTLLPALIIGWATVGCGWFILQPGMGLGVAASKLPSANAIRQRGILGHTIFGLAMYGAALLISS